MKLKGFKIDGKVYFVSDAKIAEHGTLEKAANAVKASKEKPIEVVEAEKPAPKKKAEKVEPTPEPGPAETETVE